MQQINGKWFRQDATGQWFVWTNEGTLLNCWGWLATTAPRLPANPWISEAEYLEAERRAGWHTHAEGR